MSMSLSRVRASLTALAMVVAPCAIASAADAPPITVITHLDILPTFTAQALPILEQFVTDSRSDPGTKYFTLITWAPTTNHYQLLEGFDSLEAFDRHVSASHTIAFRAAIQPFIGSPIDERLYTANGHAGR
jgi:quinol monooxygenase YgiN